jgi:DNA-binding beta-propeller fold protein YncE
MLTSNAPGYYSGGVAVDAATRKAYVSSSLGFLQYDLDTRGAPTVFPASASEGFALDTKAGRIYSPFYLCNPNPADPGFCYPFAQPGGPDLTDSVDVVDLASGKTYAVQNPDAADPHAPLGFDPDDLAVDFSLGLAGMANEESATIRVLDLAAATYDPDALSCRMPATAVPMPGPFYTALAADPATHLLVVTQEDREGIAFLDLAKAKQGIVSMLPATMPDRPDGAPWVNMGDPHGTIIGVVNGRSYAFVGAADRTLIARIDLAGVRQVLDGHGTFASHVAFISLPWPP